MKRKAISLLWKFLLWMIDDKVKARARQLTAAVEAADQSGEWKRHQVYSMLLKEFPRISKRDIGLAIELALR